MEDIPLISGILFAILFSLTTLIYFIISLLEYSFFKFPAIIQIIIKNPKMS